MIPLPSLLKLKYPNINFDIDVSLYDIGNGPEICQWNLLNVVKPSSEDIQEWMNDPIIISAYQAEQNAIINSPIIDQLIAIDQRSIRALRTNDTALLTSLETQAAALRAQLVK